MEGIRKVDRALRVHRNVARLLSHATYRQIVLALRELVANAADANSPRVDIDFRLPEELAGSSLGGGSLTVMDYGDGMTKQQFEGFYLTVGNTSKTGAKTNAKGRKIIGRFGVGFLSVIPFAETVTIETRSRGSQIVHGATIKSEVIMGGIEEPRADGRDEFRIDGWDRPPRPEEALSFTRIKLDHLTPLAHETLVASLDHYGFRFYRDRSKPITTADKEQFLRVWLARVLPLGYQKHSETKLLDVIAPLPATLYDLLGQFLPSDYSPILVYFNGEPLRRAVAGEPVEVREIIFNGEKGITARGLLWSPRAMVDPKIMRGITIRVADMAVGFPDDLQVANLGRQYGLLHHITGEVHLAGADNDISITRESFSPGAAIQEFMAFMQEQIISFETSLRKPSDVMRHVRRFKKDIQYGSKDQRKTPTISPVVTARARFDKLLLDAKEVGIEIASNDSTELTIPRGERELRVGRDFISELGWISVHGERLQVKVHREDGEPASAGELIETAMNSSPGTLEIAGPSHLLSVDEWAMSNVRLLAVLVGLIKRSELNTAQAIRILEVMEASYEV